MRYRAAVSDDLNPLFQLEQQLFSSENYPVSRRMFKYHLEHNFILLAENESQEIVGYILALRRKTWAKIYSLGVSSKYRGAGVGFVLLKEMLEYLHHQDKKRVVLEVRIDNKQAISLYAKCGFKKLKISPSFYKDGCDALIMQRLEK